MQRRTFLQSAVTLTSLAATRNLTAQQPKANQQMSIDTMPNYSPTGVNLIKGSTPAADGFYYPPEWDRHDFTIMIMPPPQNWKGYGIPLSEVRGQWADVANALAEYEHVLMVVLGAGGGGIHCITQQVPKV